ncbi:hypothetical protein N9B34_01940 [Akkermansiaceae bacterium]|nr:hypothetical protein [Akkermansiaceae bacterium]
MASVNRVILIFSLLGKCRQAISGGINTAPSLIKSFHAVPTDIMAFLKKMK